MVSRRRVGRVRNELRLWLRSHYGVRPSYSRAEIDHGRQDLGFGSKDDALVAYTFFGADLAPDPAELTDFPMSAEELADPAIDAELPDVTDLFSDV